MIKYNIKLETSLDDNYNPEEEAKFKRFLKADDLYCALIDIKGKLREIWKYGELSDETFKKVEEIRDYFFNVMDENGINLEKDFS